MLMTDKTAHSADKENLDRIQNSDSNCNKDHVYVHTN